MRLDPPHPYFGSKAEAADQIWAALGSDILNFVDPTCGSCAVLYGRPNIGPIETVNDAWGFIPNFLRAIKRRPREVAKWADWPVSEVDLHARHRWLLRTVTVDFVQRLREEPLFYDARVAGYWVWGQSIWIGSGWCTAETPASKLPYLAGAGPGERDQHPHYGRGIFRRQLPSPTHWTPPDGLSEVPGPRRRDILVHYFELLSARLERVRITCGDWRRVCTPAVTYAHGLTGMVFDPPYGREARYAPKLYGIGGTHLAPEIRAWVAENGENPQLRIVLCGYEGEHEELAELGWEAVAWKNRGGYGNQGGDNANAGRERLWLSPYCVRQAKQLSMDAVFEARA